jgi:hypothetical protein
MSTVAYPITTGDASSGGVTTTITAFSLSDSASGVENLTGPGQSVTVTPQPSLYGPAIIPLITPGSTVTFLLPVCVPKPIMFSQLSGGVTVYTHCPNETIQPSLWNSRRAILINQLGKLAVLIQLINYVNSAIASDLYNEYNNIMNKLSQLPTVNVGDPVSHEHYNVIYDHISLANDVIYYYFDVLYGYFGALPPFIANVFSPVGYVLTRMFKKSSMDMLYSGDWNNLTNALYAIDQALQIIQNYLPLLIKLSNPGYTYPSGQQIPIAIQPSNYLGINEDLSNVYFIDSSGNKIPYWIEVDANNNNGTAVAWLKLTDTVINQLNSGSSTIMLLPTPSSVIDGVNYGINSAITGSLSTDNIGNIMDQGLIYSIWANTSKQACLAGNPPTNEPLIGASLNTSSLTFNTSCGSFTDSLESSLNVISSLFSSSIPCVVSSGSYSKCNSCNNSPQCTNQGNMLFAWQSNYCCASSAPVSGSYTWLAKVIGWVQAQQAVTMYVLVDDAINTWYSLTGELGSDGANWASGGVGIVNSWTNQVIQTSPYTGTIPFGTHRFDLHYANVDCCGAILMAWFSNTINMYHAKFVPYGYMPSVSITKMSF